MRYGKVFKDMFFVQLSWTLWFLGIATVIHLIRMAISVFHGGEVDHFYNAIFVAGNIYMLIIGIICIYFLTYFVENGVTRKEYFVGGLLASAALSVVIPVISLIVTTAEKLLLNNIVSFRQMEIMPELESDAIGDIVQSIVITPYVDPEKHLLLAIGIFSLNIFIYYIFGWLISASFYRFQAMFGIAVIGVLLIALLTIHSLIRSAANLPIFHTFSFIEGIPSSLAILTIFLLLFIVVFLIRQLTKKVAVKI